MNQTEALIDAYQNGYRIVNGIAYRSDGYMMSSISDRYGYLFFKPNKNVPVYIHRLIAYQKWGSKIFEDGIQVRHLDNNHLNNLDENIALGDQSQNMMDIPKEQRRINAGNQGRKYPHEQIIEFYNRVRSYKKTMEKFSITSKGTLHFILKKSMATE